ncbi:MAG TPA: RDD family protein, partial [Edaphobacter sp.]|nr:RDD family protein [Edaphobacter sp.]
MAQRLAAHRARRSQQAGNCPTPIASSTPGNTRASRIAAAVAERYAHSQSYRAFLAEQAEAAIREAQAAAEVAALSAQAVADVQYQLLAELDQWTATQPASIPAEATTAPDAKPENSQFLSSNPAKSAESGLRVFLYDSDQAAPSRSSRIEERPQVHNVFDEEESLALDEEIAFRQSPTFEDPTAPIDIPANLIEFPRQLVAARRARPRLAEGPLREEAEQRADVAQLRIFEVEAIQISTAPASESIAPEWSSILLAAQPVSAVLDAPEAPFQPVFSPQTALFSLRLMAALVDGCIITAALLAFIAAFAVTVGKLPGAPMTMQTGAMGVAGSLIALILMYQLLFFTLSEATPGMRYARISLC